MPRVEGKAASFTYWFDTEKLTKKLRTATTQALDAIAVDIVKQASDNAPKDTGTLKSSIRQITPVRETKTHRLQTRVGSLLHYAFENEMRHRTKARFLRNARDRHSSRLAGEIKRRYDRL